MDWVREQGDGEGFRQSSCWCCPTGGPMNCHRHYRLHLLCTTSGTYLKNPSHSRNGPQNISRKQGHLHPGGSSRALQYSENPSNDALHGGNSLSW